MCFECKKQGYIVANYFSMQRCRNKCEIEVEVTISNTTCNDVMDDTDFLAFMALIIVEDPPTISLEGQDVITEDDDDQDVIAKDDDNQDELLDNYNELLLEYIRSEKAKKKALEKKSKR